MPERGGKRAGEQPAKDVAEALGIAAGVQSGWLGAAAAPAPLDPAQRQVSAGAKTPPSKPGAIILHMDSQKKKKQEKMHREHTCLQYVYACHHTRTHTSDRPYTDVPVITMTMSTHTAA